MVTEVDRLMRVPDDRVRQTRPGMVSPVLNRKRWGKYGERLRKTGSRIVSGLRAATAPALVSLQDHWMSISAMGCFVWAASLWCAQAGLVTAGVLLVLFEMKVGD